MVIFRLHIVAIAASRVDAVVALDDAHQFRLARETMPSRAELTSCNQLGNRRQHCNVRQPAVTIGVGNHFCARSLEFGEISSVF